MCNQVRSGFMLTEVLITVAIVGMVMIPLFGLQGSLLTKLKRSADSLVRLLHVSVITRQARNDQPIAAQTFTLEQKLGDPAVQVHYQLERPAKESSLASLDGLFVEKITLQWTEQGAKRTDYFANVIFRPGSEVKE